MSFDIGIEPSLEPPDPRQFCNDPQCEYCKLSVWDCPGIEPTDPDHEEEL